jgi:TonB-dependent receptor
MNSVLAGEHRTGKGNETRLDWNVSTTSINTKMPDTRNFLLSTDSVKKEIYSVNVNVVDILQSLLGYSRVWSDNDDFIYGGAFNITTPFILFKNKQLVKGGVLFQNRNRVATGTVLPISGLKGTLDSLLAPSAYYPGGGQVNIGTASVLSGSGNYNAGSSLLAAYESLENRISNKIRIIWGLRVENYQQTVNVYTPVFFASQPNPEYVPAKFAARTTFNFLPSVNFVYSPAKSFNFRAAYSNTVIRPELKDLAPYERFDLQTFNLTGGNSDLKSTAIQNYDLKLEWFPSSGELMSVAAFYKKLQDPIEYARSTLTNNLSSRYALNTGVATVKGVEAEIRKKLDFIPFAPWLSNVTVFGNGALITSKVQGKEINSILISSFADHPLTGQPDYIINTGITIEAFKNTFEATVSYNRTADYVTELGTSDLDIELPGGCFSPRIPHYVVQGRDMVDVVVSQAFMH